MARSAWIDDCTFYCKRICYNHAIIRAEIDLINAFCAGIPTVFERDVYVKLVGVALEVKVIEAIEYFRSRELLQDDAFWLRGRSASSTVAKDARSCSLLLKKTAYGIYMTQATGNGKSTERIAYNDAAIRGQISDRHGQISRVDRVPQSLNQLSRPAHC